MWAATRGGRYIYRVIIDGESPAVSDVLSELARVAVAAGAEIHSQVRIVERAGQVSVHTSLPSQSPPPTLISIPSAILVPVNDLQWGAGPDMTLIGGTESLTSLQRDVLDIQIAFYEATHKLSSTAAMSPKLAFGPDSPTTQAIAHVRPWFRTSDTPASVFISTRTLGVKAADGVRHPMLIPLLELFNHHRKGAGFSNSDDGVFLRLAQPTGTSECFASYGSRRDCLDLALNYCYYDPDPSLAKCTPMTLSIPALGSLRIENLESQRVSQLNPPTVRRESDALVINHLTFNTAHPERLAATVGLALRSAFLQANVAAAQAATVETLHLIGREMIQRHQAVINTLTEVPSAPADLVRAACERQVSLITEALTQLT